MICLSINPSPHGNFLIILNEFINSFQSETNLPPRTLMWFENKKVRQFSFNVLNSFLSFVNLNKTIQTVKFVAQISNRQNVDDSQNLESILSVCLFEDGFEKNVILPTKPQEISIDSELLLSWTKCPADAMISNFVVNIYRKADISNKTQSLSTNGTQYQIKTSELQPGETYQFSVQAECAGGLSEESDKAEITTKAKERLLNNKLEAFKIN